MRCLFIFLLHVVSIPAAHAQEQEIEQLLLNVEKLAQFKQILQDMKEGYKILTNGYNTIKDLSEGNFNLHHLFLNELLQVSPAVQRYYKIAKIVAMQRDVVRAIQHGVASFRESNMFSTDEIDHIQSTGNAIIKQSAEHLVALTTVLTAGTLRMSDAERLDAIDQLFIKVSDQVAFVTEFNNSTGLLALQRLKERRDINDVKVLHGIK